MTIKLDTIDELWELKPPTFSPRSRLFHLVPIGIGTPHVESLTSYVSRLAVAHSVPPGTLLAIEIGPKRQNKLSSQYPQHGGNLWSRFCQSFKRYSEECSSASSSFRNTYFTH